MSDSLAFICNPERLNFLTGLTRRSAETAEYLWMESRALGPRPATGHVVDDFVVSHLRAIGPIDDAWDSVGDEQFLLDLFRTIEALADQPTIEILPDHRVRGGFRACHSLFRLVAMAHALPVWTIRKFTPASDEERWLLGIRGLGNECVDLQTLNNRVEHELAGIKRWPLAGAAGPAEQERPGKDERNKRALEILRTNPDLTARQLAEILSCAASTAVDLPAWIALSNRRKQELARKKSDPTLADLIDDQEKELAKDERKSRVPGVRSSW